MRYLHYILIFLFCSSANGSDLFPNKLVLSKTSVINFSDTVVFDLTQAIVNGNSISFPVSILSDDTIYAMDFSFKYSQPNLTFDSTVNLTNYIQSIAYYNSSDSTLRYSSYSTSQAYSNNTSLLHIYFTAILPQFNAADMFEVKAYLNGTLCAFKIIDAFSSGTNELADKTNYISIYPNPARETLYIEHPEKSNINIFNSVGVAVPLQNFDAAINEINIKGLSNGIYLVKIWNETFSITRKILITN